MSGPAIKKPRGDLFFLNPFTDICIVTPRPHPNAGPMDRVDPSHPCCEKFERTFTKEEVLDVERRGIIQATRAIKDGDNLVIMAVGRGRVRKARAAQIIRDTENATLPEASRKPPITVPVQLIRGDALALRGAMLAENIQRAGYTPLQTAQHLADYATMGADDALIVAVTGQKKSWVRSHLALLDTAPEVQAHVAAGRVSVTAAATVSDLPRAEQVVAVQKLLEGGKATVAKVQRAVKVAKGGSDVVPPKRKELKALRDGELLGLTERQRAVLREVLTYVLDGTKTGIIAAILP